MIIKPYFEDPSVLHLGTCENRSYFVPTSPSHEDVYMEDSDRVIMLSGDDWKFQFYANPYMVGKFYETDFNPQKFDGISLPSCWQILGYDTHQYTNVRYPFPFDPPYTPAENPCGAYIKNFEIHSDQLTMKSYLNFEGVDSCFYVWVNGKFVGYSQVSHSTSEFDISSFLCKGENKLAVLVLKWCDGSYLEDQDKLRMSGIFRDVYILSRPESHIRDYYVKTTLDSTYKNARVSIDFEWVGKSAPINVTLLDPMGGVVETKPVQKDSVSFDVKNALLWNAESPYLYEAVIHTDYEKIHQEIGIRVVEVKGKVLYVNGVPVKFKGVNRHDSDPFTGYTISKEQLLLDVALMKRHNINAIRTSHYPNAPWATQIYNQLGFYVIAESDIESHGTVTLYDGGTAEWGYDKEFFEDKTYGMLCHDPQFEEAILDRVQRNVCRDKNNASVVLWSLGNESGYGPNMEKAAAWIKSFDKTMLVHYESSVNQMKGYKNDTSNLDVFSRMYASPADVDTIVGSFLTKPFIQCEFVHAMGNGPGDIEDYFEQIYKYDEFAGGFVWEWCDHAVWMGKTIDGKNKFYYGGDFGEFPHDGNFCMDGLVYPNRTPHTGLYEWKNCARPMRVYDVDAAKGKIKIANKLDFTNLEDAVTVRYEVSKNGVVVETGAITDLDIPAKTEKEVKISFKLPTKGNCYLRIISYQKTDAPCIEAGYELGFDQLLISKEARKALVLAKTPAISVKESETTVCLCGDAFKYTFNRLTGTFDTLVKDTVNILAMPMEFNIWRAPTDNDREVRKLWKKAGYDRKTVKVYKTSVEKNDCCVKVFANLAISAIFIQRILTINATWTIYNDGKINVHMDVEKDTGLPFLPRFGLRMMLPKNFDIAEYIGYGPYESYIDKRKSSYYAKFTSKVADLHEDYIKPQENGSHYGCTEVSVCDEKGFSVKAEHDSFSCNVSNYTQEELGTKMHNFELKESGFTVLCLDSHMSGIGSGSCGPQLHEKYQVKEKNFTLDFTISLGK